MKKATLVKILCLAVMCAMLIPMVIACGETAPAGTGSSADTSEKVTVKFKLGYTEATVIDGELTVQATKGQPLDPTLIPDVGLAGYKLAGWSYDSIGQDVWNSADTMDVNVVLWAIWTKDDIGGTTNSSNNGGDTTGSSNNGGDTTGSSNTDGETTNSSEGGSDVIDPPDDGKVTVEFNTGTGYFGNGEAYEIELDKGGRLSSFPTPVHDKAAMLFEGWYLDSACTEAASLSMKYNEDTMLYALWLEQVECSDGSYNHVWGNWDSDTAPTCSKAGIDARYCTYCGNKQTKDGDPALGHLWGQWTEAFMRKERACGRLGCTDKEIVDYENVTLALLGTNGLGQLEIEGSWYDSGTGDADLFDGNWKQPSGTGFASNGKTDVLSVTVTLLEPSYMDRIYMKGRGSGSVSIQVLYEGSSDYLAIGTSAFFGDVENSKPIEEMSVPYAEVDTSKKVVAVKFVQTNPPNGTSIWEEFAFVKVTEEE